MNNLYELVKKLVILNLRGKDAPSSEEISRHIKAVMEMQVSLGNNEAVDQDALYREILSQVSTWQADPHVLRDGKHIDWLSSERAQTQWNFWKRYRDYLETEKNWPSIVTSRLDKITDSILNDIGNPKQDGKWDRRGMVVGEVQSGKTANYTGLICKAVDSGYKLIIVLAGMTNDLRSQTQSRLDAEFLGFESEVERVQHTGSRIGVGKIDDSKDFIVHPLTYSSKDGDFRANKAASLRLGGDPILLVVKKNSSVLRRIHTWVQSQGKPHPETGEMIVDDVPLLLLDDEADNASINTRRPDQDPTTINRNIRLILNTFQKRSYVGYTATPFANIFILPDDDGSTFGQDLFPRNFIYYIRPPTNYLGPARLFGLNEDLDGGGNTTQGLPLVRTYADDAVPVFPFAHNKRLDVQNLPDSMHEALRSFIITCAARRVRGQKNVHNSMLIHVTRFNDVQQQVVDLVNEELINMRRMIEHNTGKQSKDFLEELEKIWDEDYLPTTIIVRNEFNDPQIVPLKWEDVRRELFNAITKIEIRAINGDIGHILDYQNHPNGLNVIAIGGDKLSRGLTLEGLSVSYYVRPSQNYDTLLQMGRWFGYRPGYVDLCRLYTTADLVAWYEHIVVANEELRREFNLMELSKLTPEDYGLKIRTHPNGLNITAANKIRHGQRMRVSFSGHLVQTTIFDRISDVHELNFKSTERLIRSLPAYIEKKRNFVWENIAASGIISFLESYRANRFCRQAEPDLLIKYIRKQNENNELINWTIALVNNNSKGSVTAKIADLDIGLTDRRDNIDQKRPTNFKDLYMMSKSNIISPIDQSIDLLPEERQKALADNLRAFNANLTRNSKEPTEPSGPFIRRNRPAQRGLLLLYPLNHTNSAIGTPFSSTPIIGFAISFPESSRAELSAIEYQVNTRFWIDRYGTEDEDDDV